MTAVIIKRQLFKEEINEIFNLTAGDKSIKLYTSVSLPESLKNLTFHNPELNESLKKKINYDILKKTLEFGEKKIEGKSVCNWLTIDKASIWHYHKFRIYFSIRNLFIEVTEINEILKSFDNIILFTNDSRIEIQFSGKTNHKIDFRCRKVKLKKDYLSFIHYIIYIKLRFLQNIFVSVRNAKHMVFNVTIPVTYLDIPGLRPVKGNYILGYMLQKANKDFILNSESETPKFTKNNKFRLGRNITKKLYSISTLHSEGLMFKRIISVSLVRKIVKCNRYLKNIYCKTAEKPEGELDFLFLELIKKFHNSTLYFLFKYYAYISFFKKYKIKSVTSTDENSPEIKSIFDAAKSTGVTTIGIQHGAIHELHPAYMYSKTDRERKIMSDYTLVWGKFYKSLLTEKGNYDPSSLIINGHIRSDVIPHLMKSERTIKPLSHDNPVIVFASQPQRDESLRRRSATDIFTAAKKLENVYLLVKLHPAEKNDKNYYTEIARETGCSNYKILLDEDLYLLIASCKALITCFSTVGTETAYFYKPLIILDHLKQDIQGYKKEGIAYQVTDSNELHNCLNGILEGKLTIDKNAYDKFIDKYAFKIDGKSSDRCLNFIKSLV